MSVKMCNTYQKHFPYKLHDKDAFESHGNDGSDDNCNAGGLLESSQTYQLELMKNAIYVNPNSSLGRESYDDLKPNRSSCPSRTDETTRGLSWRPLNDSTDQCRGLEGTFSLFCDKEFDSTQPATEEGIFRQVRIRQAPRAAAQGHYQSYYQSSQNPEISPSNIPHSRLVPSPAKQVTYRKTPQTETQLQSRRSTSETTGHTITSVREIPTQKFGQHEAARKIPLVNGTSLVDVASFPDRIRHIFPYRLLNAVQSECYDKVYRTDDNFVVAAPTGSGKTVVLELAICRLVVTQNSDKFKAVYIAPTRALCSERARDWTRKFNPIGVQCVEVTGETATRNVEEIGKAQIIVTTPEKWESLTRYWKDHKSIINLLRLLLIDEVHFLDIDRGATLEVVVSRMRSMQRGVRFVAVSATIPNVENIAEWLGRNCFNEDHLPAHMQVFGEEFRPVKIERHIYPVDDSWSEYHVDNSCNKHIPDIIQRYSNQQPVLIFCFTKRSCLKAAISLKERVEGDGHVSIWWKCPREIPKVSDTHLKDLVRYGIAVHHGDVTYQDRASIENGFLNGTLSVIFCTSTLATGINLPCNTVIIKNTTAYTSDGLRDYKDVEIMQMIGRAGRPQYASHCATAIIMTSRSKVEKFSNLVTERQPLESSLHVRLVEHMNVEIGLGTIKTLVCAELWLKKTFLSIRMRDNPSKYQIPGLKRSSSKDECVTSICKRNIDVLTENELVEKYDDKSIQCTPLGETMNRYCVKISTLVEFKDLSVKRDVLEVLLVLANASEYGVDLHKGEVKMYQKLNKSSGIRFPCEQVSDRAHKVSLIIQSELGGMDPPFDLKSKKTDMRFVRDRTIIFDNIQRVTWCLIECRVFLKDAITVRNALEVARCLGSRTWESSPLQMRQIPGIGPVSIRKFSQAGIFSIESLEECEPSKVNIILGKSNQGEKLRGELRTFPRLRVTVSLINIAKKSESLSQVMFKLQGGFLNEKVPNEFAKKPLSVCIMAERSDNSLISFQRMRPAKLEDPIIMQTELKTGQHITCYIMCDEIAGTLKQADLKPNLSDNLNERSTEDGSHGCSQVHNTAAMNISRKRSLGSSSVGVLQRHVWKDEVLSIASASEDDIIAAEKQIDMGFSSTIEEIDLTSRTDKTSTESIAATQIDQGSSSERYECRHSCKSKTKCKHLCCREGLDKPPRDRKPSQINGETLKRSQSNRKTQSNKKLSFARSKLCQKPPDSSSRKPQDEKTSASRGNGICLSSVKMIGSSHKPRKSLQLSNKSMYNAQSSQSDNPYKSPKEINQCEIDDLAKLPYAEGSETPFVMSSGLKFSNGKRKRRLPWLSDKILSDGRQGEGNTFTNKRTKGGFELDPDGAVSSGSSNIFEPVANVHREHLSWSPDGKALEGESFDKDSQAVHDSSSHNSSTIPYANRIIENSSDCSRYALENRKAQPARHSPYLGTGHTLATVERCLISNSTPHGMPETNINVSGKPECTNNALQSKWHLDKSKLLDEHQLTEDHFEKINAMDKDFWNELSRYVEFEENFVQ